MKVKTQHFSNWRPKGWGKVYSICSTLSHHAWKTCRPASFLGLGSLFTKQTCCERWGSSNFLNSENYSSLQVLERSFIVLWFRNAPRKGWERRNVRILQRTPFSLVWYSLPCRAKQVLMAGFLNHEQHDQNLLQRHIDSLIAYLLPQMRP